MVSTDLPPRRQEDAERLSTGSDVHLTPRQQDVTRLIAEGLSAKAIAHRLSISQKTVEFHKRCSMERTGAASAAELVRYAVESQLVGKLIVKQRAESGTIDENKRRRSDR